MGCYHILPCLFPAPPRVKIPLLSLTFFSSFVSRFFLKPNEMKTTKKAKQSQLSSPLPSSFIGPSLNGYEAVFPRMVKDVSYFMNKELASSEKVLNTICINAALEESTVGARTASPAGLLPHDEFVKRTATSRDTIIASVGGNDVALKPTVATIAAVFMLTRTPLWLLKLLGPWAPGWGHMEWVFGGQVEAFLKNLVAGSPSPPREVIVCMIYFLDERPGGSWAGESASGCWTFPFVACQPLLLITRDLHFLSFSLSLSPPPQTTSYRSWATTRTPPNSST